MADSRIKSASELLSTFFDADMAAKGREYSGFSRSWRTIAGPRLGEHTKPVDIRHGILIIEAEHQGWMQLLQMEQDRLLEDIGRNYADLGIRGIAFRLSNGSLSPQAKAEPALPKAAERQETAPPAEAEPAPERPIPDKNELPGDLLAKFAVIRKHLVD
jgi:hypothetical protein